VIMELRPEHAPYAPASATNVQRTWKQYGWTPPSKDAVIIAKWEYYKSLSLLSETTLHIKKD
jgi:hypothetical protein